MFEPIRLGVVGVGSFRQLHAQTALGLAEAQLVALVPREARELDALPASLRQVPAWTDLDEAIADSGADAWIVATATASHGPVTRQLLAARQAVLLERLPRGARYEDAMRIMGWLARLEDCAR